MDLSHNDDDFIMGLINIILFLAFSGPGGEITLKHEDIITQMLQNIQQALSKFDLNNHTTTYAVCPACHCTYKPWYKKGSLVLKCVAIDQLRNLGFVENRYYTRGMGHQNQSKPSFTTISMISLAIYCLAKTWRKPWIKHVMA